MKAHVVAVALSALALAPATARAAESPSDAVNDIQSGDGGGWTVAHSQPYTAVEAAACLAASDFTGFAAVEACLGDAVSDAARELSEDIVLQAFQNLGNIITANGLDIQANTYEFDDTDWCPTNPFSGRPACIPGVDRAIMVYVRWRPSGGGGGASPYVEMTFCNKSAYSHVSTVVGYLNPLHEWVSTGWFVIPQGQCANVITSSNMVTNTNVYYYGYTSEGGGHSWPANPSGYSFCINLHDTFRYPQQVDPCTGNLAYRAFGGLTNIPRGGYELDFQ